MPRSLEEINKRTNQRARKDIAIAQKIVDKTDGDDKDFVIVQTMLDNVAFGLYTITALKLSIDPDVLAAFNTLNQDIRNYNADNNEQCMIPRNIGDIKTVFTPEGEVFGPPEDVAAYHAAHGTHGAAAHSGSDNSTEFGSGGGGGGGSHFELNAPLLGDRGHVHGGGGGGGGGSDGHCCNVM